MSSFLSPSVTTSDIDLSAPRGVLFGALRLSVDFINLVISLLRIFGGSRS